MANILNKRAANNFNSPLTALFNGMKKGILFALQKNKKLICKNLVHKIERKQKRFIKFE